MRDLRILLVLSLALAACSPPPKAEEVKHYSIHGEIVALESKDSIATIKHSEIKGWMGAMTMQFPVKSNFATLHVGDKIDGTVNVQGMDYWVSDVHPQK